MKRCPQCEFIYNDDQNVCDMDGKALVHEADIEPLPAISAEPAKRNKLKMFGVPAIAGLALAAVIVIGYYATPLLTAQPTVAPQPVINKQDLAPEPSNTAPPQSQTFSQPSSLADASSSADGHEPHQPSTVVAHDPRLTIPRELPPLSRVPPLPRLPPAKVAPVTSTAPKPVTAQRRTTSPPKKEESDVKSFLKKTGRILKKPFKF